MPRTEILGSLRCHIEDRLPAGADPRLLVVLCHGFGAPGTDLVRLGAEVLRQRPELAESVRFCCPEAPVSLADAGMPGGRAWWILDLDRLNAAMATGEFRDLRHESPAELPAARQKLTALLDEVQAATSLPPSRIVLGGFSQGAMLATDVALRLPEKPALLTIFSGSLLTEDDWRERAAAASGLPVLQSHGREDMILPFQAALWLRDLLQEAGCEVEFIPFHGPHTIPPEAVQRFTERLAELAPGRSG